MSYVLEALKKAQAQREQGGVPGIHSTQVPYVAVDGRPRSNPKPLLWSIAALLGVIAALLAWRSMSGGDAAPTSPPARSASAPRAAMQGSPAAPTASEPLVAAPAAQAPPALPSLQPQPTPAPDTLASGPAQSPASAERTAASKRSSAASTETAKPAPRTVTRADTKADAKSKLPRVYALAELPEEVRSALPTLVISGGSYSASPSQRLIIVNNQVFTESSQPAPGVVVERIEPTAVVLSFKGYSYRVGY